MTLRNISPKKPGLYPCFTAGTACGQIELCKAYHQRNRKQVSLRQRRIKGDSRRTLSYRQWVEQEGPGRG